MDTERESLVNPLDDWLLTLSTDGDLESEGDGFSIAEEKAWEKLGAFQLPFQGAWVLKLVQAAVVGGAEAIRVVQSRTQTTFTFPGIEDCRWEDIHGLFFAVDSTSDSAQGHLAVALRALAKSVGNPFFLNLPNDCAVVWDGTNFQTAVSTEPQLEIRISHFVAARLIKAIRFMTSVQKALDDHCHLCPIPLTVDRRHVNSVGSDIFCRPSEDFVPLAFLVAKPSEELPEMLLPKTCWESKFPKGVRPAFSGEEPFESSEEPCGAAMVVCGFRRPVTVGEVHFQVYSKSSQLIWVCDGVIVSRELLKFKRDAAVLLLANAKELETDLTGFQLRKNREFKLRRKAGIRALAIRLSRVRQQQKIFAKGKTSIKSLLGWGGIALGVLLPPAGLALYGIRLFTKRLEHGKHAVLFDRELFRLEQQLAELAKS